MTDTRQPGRPRKPESEKLTRRWDAPTSAYLDDRIIDMARKWFGGSKAAAIRYAVSQFFELVDKQKEESDD